MLSNARKEEERRKLEKERLSDSEKKATETAKATMPRVVGQVEDEERELVKREETGQGEKRY